MTNESEDAVSKPTQKQIEYIRDLCSENRIKFSMPRTRLEASKKIDELKHMRNQDMIGAIDPYDFCF